MSGDDVERITLARKFPPPNPRILSCQWTPGETLYLAFQWLQNHSCRMYKGQKVSFQTHASHPIFLLNPRKGIDISLWPKNTTLSRNLLMSDTTWREKSRRRHFMCKIFWFNLNPYLYKMCACRLKVAIWASEIGCLLSISGLCQRARSQNSL